MNSDYIIYFFPVIFIPFWVLVCLIISLMGWRELSKKYRFNGKFKGISYGLTSGTINSINYRSSLVMKCNDQGLYLDVFFLFKFFHPAIFIPWKEIRHVQEQKIFFLYYTELTINTPSATKIKLYTNTFKKIEKTYLAAVQ